MNTAVHTIRYDAAVYSRGLSQRIWTMDNRDLALINARMSQGRDLRDRFPAAVVCVEAVGLEEVEMDKDTDPGPFAIITLDLAIAHDDAETAARIPFDGVDELERILDDLAWDALASFDLEIDDLCWDWKVIRTLSAHERIELEMRMHDAGNDH